MSSRELSSELKWWHKTAYGTGHVSNDLFAAIWFSYFVLYMKTVVELDASLTGILFLLGQVVDGVATACLGIAIDRWGKKMTWYLLGSVVALLSFPFIFALCSDFELPLWGIILYYSIFITVFQIAWSTVQISNLSLIPELTRLHNERDQLAAFRHNQSQITRRTKQTCQSPDADKARNQLAKSRSMMDKINWRHAGTVISNLLVYSIVWARLSITVQPDKNLGPEDDYKWREIVLTTAAISIVTNMWFFVGLRKLLKVLRIKSRDQIDVESRTMCDFLKSALLWQSTLLYVSSRLLYTTSQVYIPIFVMHKIEGKPYFIAIVPFVIYIASFLAAFTVQFVSKKTGNQILYLVGGIFSLAGCLWIGFGFDEKPNIKTLIALFGSSILLGIGISMTTITSLNITSSLIGQNLKNGAFIYSVVTFADKLINGVTVVIIEHLNKERLEYYQNVLIYLCGGSALMGIIILCTMLKCKKNTEVSST